MLTIFYGYRRDGVHDCGDVHDDAHNVFRDDGSRNTNDYYGDDGSGDHSRNVQMQAEQLKLKRQVKRFF